MQFNSAWPEQLNHPNQTSTQQKLEYGAMRTSQLQRHNNQDTPHKGHLPPLKLFSSLLLPLSMAYSLHLHLLLHSVSCESRDS